MDDQDTKGGTGTPPFEQESLFRFLTERMTDVVWTVDLNLQTTYVSPSVLQVHGYTPEERVRQKPEDQVTPESYARAMEILAAELEREQRGDADRNRTMAVEMEYINKDGSTVWMENLVSGIWDADGMPVGLHGVSRDITDRKALRGAASRKRAKYRLLTGEFHRCHLDHGPERAVHLHQPVGPGAGRIHARGGHGDPLRGIRRPGRLRAVMAQIAAELAKPSSSGPVSGPWSSGSMQRTGARSTSRSAPPGCWTGTVR
jgi:PAS domain S-box-containing protein